MEVSKADEPSRPTAKSKDEAIDAKARQSRTERKPSGKLRSYVTQAAEAGASTTEAAERTTQRTQVDEAGIRAILAYEKQQGRQPEEMAHHNVGFDVKSKDRHNQILYIEVKSLSGRWSDGSPTALSKAQYEAAREKGRTYWLYMVEHALSIRPCIYRIQNPAQRINQYLFDEDGRP